MMRLDKFCFLLLSSFLLLSCAENQVTGRRQLLLLPENELQNMASDQYRSFLTQAKVQNAKGSNDAAMVQKVGTRIAAAIKQYYETQGKGSLLDGYRWEFNLIQNTEINAWCMPGGKVAVYAGLLPVAENEAGLAVVMGHEIAHAIALHGNERMSQGLVQQLGSIGLQVALADKPAETQNIFLQAYGIGTNLGAMLPFSRKQELEADRFGLIFAAMAGYDPQEAIPFWQRMSAAGGQKPPEFMSTHPSDATRIAKMKGYIQEAMRYYQASAK